MADEEELTDTARRTLCDTLRGSIAMFDMLLAECGSNSETARVVGDAAGGARGSFRRSRGAYNAERAAVDFASV